MSKISRKTIDASREVRLWIRDVIVPTCIGLGTLVAMNPEFKEQIKDKIVSARNKMTYESFKK